MQSYEQLKDFTESTEAELVTVRKQKKDYHHRIIDWAKIANEYLTYAEKAPKIFADASNERKREILRTFGSNLLVTDKKLIVTAPKTLTSIKSAYNQFLSDFTSLEPVETQALKGFTGLEEGVSSDLLQVWDDVRTNLIH